MTVKADTDKLDEMNPEISRFMNNYNLTDLSRKLKALNIPPVIIDGPNSKVFFQNIFQQIFDEQQKRDNQSQESAGINNDMETGAKEGPAKMNSQR